MDSEITANSIKQRGADVYFYADVENNTVLDCIDAITDAIAYLHEQKAKRIYDYMYDAPLSVRLHINSLGGSGFAMMALHDHIKSLSIPVDVFIEGIAASAASVVMLAGRRIYAAPNSFVMIHEAHAVATGRYSEHKDYQRMFDMLHNRVISLYASKMDLSHDEINELLRHDYWMDAREAYERGLVDEIIGVTDGR